MRARGDGAGANRHAFHRARELCDGGVEIHLDLLEVPLELGVDTFGQVALRNFSEAIGERADDGGLLSLGLAALRLTALPIPLDCRALIGRFAFEARPFRRSVSDSGNGLGHIADFIVSLQAVNATLVISRRNACHRSHDPTQRKDDACVGDHR